MIAFTPPTVAQFKAQFPRDWPYGKGTETVTDGDIQNAINEAFNNFHASLFNNTAPVGTTVAESTIAYCFLTAHLMVLNLQNAGGLGAPESFQGVNTSGGGTVESKTVGSVSISYAIPDAIKNSPTLSQYMRTGYGQKYLIMIAPKIPGRRVVVVAGERTPFAPFNSLRPPIP